MSLVADRLSTAYYPHSTGKAILKKFSSQEALPTESYFDNVNGLRIQDQLARRPYDDNDQRLIGKLIDRAGPELPASAPETSRTTIGKVRQLFEERRKQQVRRPLQTAALVTNRTAIGRDKSYPLQPIRRSKQQEARDDSSLDGDTDSEVTQPVIYDCSIFGRLPNLGGRLLSEKKVGDGETKSSFSQSADMSTTARRNAHSSVTRITEDISRLSTGRSVVNGVQRRAPSRLPASPKQGTIQPIKKPFQSNPATTRVQVDEKLPTSNGMNTTRLAVDENRNINARKPLPTREIKKPIISQTSPAKKKPLTNGSLKPQPSIPVPSRSKPAAAAAPVKKPNQPPPPGMVNCKTCGRNFAEDRIKKHQEICEKASKTKRKKFDPLKQRLKGTEAEGYINQIKSTKKAAPPPKKDTWRKQHEDFINNIRAARMVKQHLEKGGKLSDLPPPPPSDTSHYVPCPHCGRKFNDAAATRHIPKCATMRHNKPKPVPANQSDASKIRKPNATRKR